MSEHAGRFVWFELATTDPSAAQDFYGTVAGWTLADAGMPGVTYAVASAGVVPVGGIMPMPEHLRAHGVRPHWTGYVAVPDVDVAAERVGQAGGSVHRAPDDIPGVGRFCVCADPQGALFVLFRAAGAPMAAGGPGAPGHVGWHELHARDWAAAWDFYAGLFGWTKTDALDMGPMGTYQLFAIQGVQAGGMMDDPHGAPHWLHYVTVEEIDAAAARVRAAGGSVDRGPHPVPGGLWIVHATDPQGAAFALVGPRAAC